MKRVLALIERAIPIEEQIREQDRHNSRKAEKSDDLLQKEIRDLTNELGAIVDEGEAVWSDGVLGRVETARFKRPPAGTAGGRAVTRSRHGATE